MYFFLFISLTLFFIADQYLGARGESESLESYRMNVRRIFSLFRNSTAERKALYVSDKVESLPLDTVITTPSMLTLQSTWRRSTLLSLESTLASTLGTALSWGTWGAFFS